MQGMRGFSASLVGLDPFSLLLGAAVGFVLGALILWLFARARAARAEAAADAGRQRIQGLEVELTQARSEAAARVERITQLERETGRLGAALQGEQRAAAEKLAVLEGAEQKLREAFQALSAEALRQNNQSFLDLAKASLSEFQKTAAADLEARQIAINALVAPIGESLGRVDGTLHTIEKERVSHYAVLIEQLKQVDAGNQQLQSQSANLVRALHQPQARGRWGEIQLRRVVEMAGMVEYCDFTEQVSVTTDAGRLRPDMVVRLPRGRNVVVDAKAPLDAYLRETADDAERERLFVDHARQVRVHIGRLSEKSYADQFQLAPEKRSGIADG